MHSFSFAFGLVICGVTALAAEQAAAPPPPKPPAPQWHRAMAVSVLVGADVPAGVDARVFPSPLILRIVETSRLPAQAQNANDCIFEADAWANLASERVTVTPRLLRCFDAQGRETFSKAIRGFGVDRDGYAGIKSPLEWSQGAKDLLLMGVGAQVKQNFLLRTAKNALGKASLGLTDNLMESNDDKKPRPEGEAIREIRGAETLLPTLAVEPGREFNVILNGT